MRAWRRRAAVALGGFCLAGLPASAQPARFPARQVTIVAGFPPGGTVDLLARVVAQRLAETWGQPVAVENRPGGSGAVASQAVAAAAPDGHTLMVVPITHVTNASLVARLPYDPIVDFTAVTLLAEQPIMLVANNALPARSVSDLVALARARPARLNCGSGGNGTSQHLACELFKVMAGVDIAHVPYRGNAAAMTDVVSGRIELLFDQMATAVPHVRDGRVRALAVTSARRAPAMPEVPTVAESGVPDYETTAWFGLVGPARMAPDLTRRIQSDVAAASGASDVRDRLADQGLTLVASPPERFGAFLSAEMARWAEVVRRSGARAD